MVVVGFARSAGVAALVMVAAILLGLTSTISTAVQLLATTALVMTGTFTPTPDQAYLDMAKNNFIVPALGGGFEPVAVTTPEQAWPITGLFDYPFGTSIRIGQRDFENAKDAHGFPDAPLLVFGYSQSSIISIREKRKLAAYAAMHPDEEPPDITFVLIGVLNTPNGGINARFPGLYIPLIQWEFNGAEPTDTPFETVVINRQWDGFGDFPLYPLNFVATANAVAGMLYVHTGYQDVTINDPGTVKQEFGDTTFYWIPTEHLPLLQLPRDLGVPEPFIAAVEPALTEIVEAGYDRDIPFGQPTPARLIPRIDRVEFARDLVDAVGQGIEDARHEIEHPTPKPPGPSPTVRLVREFVPKFIQHTISPPRRPPYDNTASTDADTATTTSQTRERTPVSSGNLTPSRKAVPQIKTGRSTSAPHRLRPKLGGPAGVFGPRIRDVLRRGHTEPSAEADARGAGRVRAPGLRPRPAG
jgi:hypothetical protein